MPKTKPHPLIPVLKALGWKPIDLARRADVAQPTISYVLNGKRGGAFSPRTARRIMRAVDNARLVGLVARRKVPPLTLEDLIFPPSERARA
jgi:predicted transcriptional regulator